jgi:hypothetical protein
MKNTSFHNLRQRLPGGGELGNFHRAPNELKGAPRRCKGEFIIYTRDWYRREMGWISHFSGV